MSSGFPLSLETRSLRATRRASTACIKTPYAAPLRNDRTCSSKDERQTNVRLTPTPDVRLAPEVVQPPSNLRLPELVPGVGVLCNRALDLYCSRLQEILHLDPHISYHENWKWIQETRIGEVEIRRSETYSVKM